MAGERLTADIVISGSGVMGLMLARNLSQFSGVMDVVVLEKANRIAAGSSIRNEGWLHAGTYHSFAIKNETDAAAVVERTQHGYRRIKEIAPEVIEDPDSHTYALFQDSSAVDMALERWKQMNVEHQAVTSGVLSGRVPNLRVENVRQGFRVADTSINTRMLYARLVDECRENGVRFLTETQITGYENDHQAQVESKTSDIDRVRGGMFIHTVGYGLRQVLDQLGIDNQTRFWKSHLMVTPRLSKDNLFFLEEKQAGVMHHNDNHGRERSILGTNVDAIFTEAPDTEVVSSKVDELNAAAGRMYADWDQVEDKLVYACVKTDVAASTELPQLTPFTWSPRPNHVCVLPGKMTEAPFVADQLTADIIRSAALYVTGRTPRFGSTAEIQLLPDITNRPCDTLNTSEAIAS